MIRLIANRMGEWTSDLTPSQQHHFRDDYEAELCARQVVQSANTVNMCLAVAANLDGNVL